MYPYISYGYIHLQLREKVVDTSESHKTDVEGLLTDYSCSVNSPST